MVPCCPRGAGSRTLLHLPSLCSPPTRTPEHRQSMMRALLKRSSNWERGEAGQEEEELHVFSCSGQQERRDPTYGGGGGGGGDSTSKQNAQQQPIELLTHVAQWSSFSRTNSALLMVFLMQFLAPDHQNRKMYTPIKECDTLLECFSKHPTVPFIVRNSTSEFHSAATNLVVPPSSSSSSSSSVVKNMLDAGLQLFLNKNDTVLHDIFTATQDDMSFLKEARLSNLARSWLDDSLVLKVFDNHMHLFDLPPDVFDASVSNWKGLANIEMRQSPAVFYKHSYTPLHQDLPSIGGGYMHLWAGEKVWHFIHQKHQLELVAEDGATMLDIQPVDAAAFVPSLEVYSVVARAGDTVLFPPGWLHRVWTMEKSIGTAGYLTLKGAEATQKFAMQQRKRAIMERALLQEEDEEGED